MPTLDYLRSQIDEMRQLMVAIATREVSLQSGGANERYTALRRRLSELSPLTGGMPSILEQTNNGWDFWNIVSAEGRGTYESRRQYIADTFSSFYAERLRALENNSLQDQLIKRDLLLEGEIGRGGFGVVYKARHLTLDTARAIKAFDPMFYLGEERTFRRFVREAGLLASLNHPHIVRFFDAGFAGNQPYLITEYVPGRDLQKQVTEDGPLQECEVTAICIQTLEGLAEAHRIQLIHRDVKPSNITWADNRVKILDFGAGTALQEAITSRLTTTALGSPGFIAPELLDNPTQTNPGIDIYSLGVTAHYLLTGRLPYLTNLHRYLQALGISEWLQLIITKALLPPEDRFQSAEEMIDALRVQSPD
jgi:hypothetical protein